MSILVPNLFFSSMNVEMPKIFHNVIVTMIKYIYLLAHRRQSNKQKRKRQVHKDVLCLGGEVLGGTLVAIALLLMMLLGLARRRLSGRV